MATSHSSFIRRYWILLVLRATCLAGAGTVSSDFFHKLVYYVNALLPSVGLPSETARVMKATYGPFFPEYQWELDRLVGAGLVAVADIKWISEDQRFFGKYRVTARGRSVAEHLANSTPGLSEIERAISEMVSAFLSTPGALSTLASKFDANLGLDTVRDGQVIDFGEWRNQNYSRDAAEFLFQTWLKEVVLAPIKEDQKGVIEVRESDLEKFEDPGEESMAVDTEDEADDEITWPANDQHSRSFHLYAHYLVHRLTQGAATGAAR